MTSAARKKGGITGWRLIAILALLAFTVQSYVAQTHIHDAAPASAAIAKKLNHDKSPLGNTPLDCPFCQAVAHAGGFFMPAAPLLFISALWVEIATPQFLLRDSSRATAHSWQSRAPPIH
jgi:hypothetical protein